MRWVDPNRTNNTLEGTDLSEENEGKMPARGNPMGKNLSTIGLHYPFIHFKNEAWLKLAAL